MANSEEEIQTLVDIAYEYASSHRYTLHPQKSAVLACMVDPPTNIKLGNNNLPTSTQLEHLGLVRNTSKPSNPMSNCIEDRVKLGRRTAYSLMTVGVYGEGGLHPEASAKIIDCYVTPRMIYGLDAVILSTKDQDRLEQFHRELIRDLQGLPKRTANAAVYLLIGRLPLRADLDCRILSLMGAISRAEPDDTLKQLAFRQLALGNSKSWFINALNTANKYFLPLEAYLNDPWGKGSWKRMVKRAVQAHWIASLIQEAGNKSSLKYLRLDLCKKGSPHPIWSSCRKHTRAIQATAIRAKLLTGTFPLQYNLKRTNQHDTDICRLCDGGSEDTQHFLLTCPASADVREKSLGNFTEILKDHNIDLPTNRSLLCRSILNGIPEPVESRHVPKSKSKLVECSQVSFQNREKNPLRDRNVGHGGIKCTPCFIGKCKRHCQDLCRCKECMRLYDRLATAASDLCLRLDLRRGEILATQQGAST